jgi:hypothetical protein
VPRRARYFALRGTRQERRQLRAAIAGLVKPYYPRRAHKVDSAEGIATLEAMSSHRDFRPEQQNKLVAKPPVAGPDEHAQLVEADQRFRAALDLAIAAGGERVEAVQATVQLKRRTKLSL